MILISKKSPKGIGSIVCEKALFDTSLISDIVFDAKEQIAIFHYDGSEFGNPLDLPIEPEEVVFNVKIANNTLLITASIIFPEDASVVNPLIYRLGGAFGDVDFWVRLTQEETLSLSLLLLKKSLESNNFILNKSSEKKNSK